MTALFAAVLNSLLPALAIAAILEIALRAARGNASTRFAARWIALVAIVALPFTALAPRNAEPALPAPAPVLVEEEPYVAPLAAPVPAPRHPVELPLERAASCAFALWFGVTAALAFRIALGYAWLRRTRRRAVPLEAYGERFAVLLRAGGVRRPVPLLESVEVRGPILAGFARPAVVLPHGLAARLSATEMEHVLLHEIAHLRRRDTWWNLAARCTGALLWFHPAVVWILRRQDQDREMACDEWVVESIGAERPYVDCLARLTEMRLAGREGLLAAGVLGRGSSIARRIESLVSRRTPVAARVSWLRLCTLALAVAVLALIAATAPAIVVAEQSGETPPAPAVPAVAPQAPEAAPAAPVAARAPRAPGAPQAAVPAAPAPPAAPAVSPIKPWGFLAGLAATGYTDLTVDEIIDLKNNGVDPGFIAGLQQAGFGKVPPRDLVNLHNSGVRPSVFAEIHALGFGPYTPREAVEMSNHGVRAATFAALKAAGIARLSVREAIEAATHGLSAADIDQAREFGTDLGFAQIMKLKKAGVI